VDDARRLMGDLDGSVLDLVNGHVMHLIGALTDKDAAIAEARAAERRASVLIEQWIAEGRAELAAQIFARCDENEQWLREEIITDDGFAQQIGLSVVADMKALASGKTGPRRKR